MNPSHTLPSPADPAYGAFSLQDRLVVVTGAASGIGHATARLLARCGAAVATVDIDMQRQERLQDQFPTELHLHADVTSPAEMEQALQTMVRRFDRPVWGLVNNAARFVMKGLEASQDDWHHVLDANLVAPTLCSRLAVERMSPSTGGAIVNVCSISSVIAQPGFLTYNASKGGLLTATKCMAQDLAPRGIRVNAVSPGSIWTDSNERFIREHRGLDRAGADRAADLGGKHLLHRLGDPLEVAHAIAFLLSPLASFVTGSNLFVDGGYTTT